MAWYLAFAYGFARDYWLGEYQRNYGDKFSMRWMDNETFYGLEMVVVVRELGGNG
jgi:hypothetical protein